MTCFCADGASTLCFSCKSVHVFVSAHAEGLERLSGREPPPMSAADHGELEWRSWGIPATRYGDR
jgi:hypothetical protein